MDKKAIPIIILLGVLVIFWVPIMTKLGFIKPTERPVATEQTTQQADSQNVKSQNVTPTQPATADMAESTAQMAESTQPDIDTLPAPPEDTIFIETNVMKVGLSNYGGGPVSLKLVDYLYAGDGEPVEMLPDNIVSTPELKFNGRSISTGSYVFECSVRERIRKVSSGSTEVTYTYRKDDATITKRYHFYADRYDYDLVIEVSNPNAIGFDRRYALEWNNKLMPTELDIADDYRSMWAMAMQAGERVKFDDYNNGQFSVTYDGTTNWVATRSKYFAAIMIPRTRPGTGTIASGFKDNLLINGKKVEGRELAIGMLMEAPFNEPVKDSFSVYVGPMDYERLNEFNNGVVDIIDIGTTPFVGWIIKIFAIPIMWLLPRMYSFIPNYGLVIIVFSLLIKLITWPLSKKTVRSMQAMKEIQPQMKELQVKHKNNPQALNREMMKLYKDKGINPLSGCLPFLPQMPLFFALFAVFRSTILLRQAPFVFWWNDLSRGAMSITDPYIILVVLMVALMFVQQKMSMTDPKNKMLTYIMPLMMGVFFYSASAGLVLYWTCFSLFSFVEQIIFRKPSQPDVEVVK
ncbi:MAG: membrane protein insertase YidC [Candidatus Zixiibacteriota bacterium]